MRNIHELLAEHEAVRLKLQQYQGKPGERLSDLEPTEVPEIDAAEELTSEEPESTESPRQTPQNDDAGNEDQPDDTLPELDDEAVRDDFGEIPDVSPIERVADTTQIDMEQDDDESSDTVLPEFDGPEEVGQDLSEVPEDEPEESDVGTADPLPEFEDSGSGVGVQQSDVEDDYAAVATVEAPEETEIDDEETATPAVAEFPELDVGGTVQSVDAESHGVERTGFQGFEDSEPVTETQLQLDEIDDPSLSVEERAEKQYAFGQQISQTIAEDLAREVSPMFDELRDHANSTVHTYFAEQTLLTAMLRPRG